MTTGSVTGARRSGVRLDQQKLVLALLLAVVSILVLGPVLVLIRASFAPAESMPLETLEFTLKNYVQLLQSPRTLSLIWNTVVYALSSMAIGVAIATAIAWCTERTDMPGRILVRILMFAWMMVPALVVGFGWILLLNPGNGALNVMFRELFGFARPLLTIYTFWSLIVVTAFAVVPTAFVMISSLLRNMDPNLEQAARVHGGNAWATLTRVTLPLLTPGLFSIGIYMFMAVVQAFDLPLIIGLSADVPVLSTRVYLLSSPDNGLPNYGLASAFGVLLLVVAAGLMWAYMRATRLGERFRVVTGKAFRPKRIKLGRWRFAALGFTFGYCAVMMLPLLILLWVSLQPSYSTPSLSALGGLSLDIYRRLLANPMISRAVLNTVILVVSSATIVMVVSSLIGWFTVRSNSKAGKILDALSFLPMAIPPIVLVLAILLLYLNTPLYGTIWILVLGHVTIYIAFGVRTMSSALIQIHKELGDAALISGASWLTSLRKVVFPLVWPQILNGWLWVFAHSARDLTVPLMLMSTGNLVAASTLWNLWQFPDLPGAAALAILLMVALLVVVVPSQLYVARRLER
ncbi:iron ABC transporter permease [Bosea sp. (in: a-proteobacteria)]|jgi:iron(III) transport system permease protein|uniref:ABC transporter permease n=1 Tax=Bosea sp. (in: a-proteobacteria) TaxID=1871050 RepID=UPI002DDDB755|nr:iron ABC transporter permease [Bosea sp. (in: a-proteobacteria)]HEV2512066.1 iron ABC transporter permease [Bosea sp. (in: a-proteobacteria)]